MLTVTIARVFKAQAHYLVFLGMLILLALLTPSPASADGGGPCKDQRSVTKSFSCPSGYTGSISASCSAGQCSFNNLCADRLGPSGGNWKIKSNTCVLAVSFSHNSYETRTTTCPATQPSGVINQRRDFEVWSDGSKRNYSAWYETSRTCAAVKSSTQTETQTLSCPSTHPSGTWTQRRTYDLWTDGTKENFSAWSDVTKTCSAVKSSTQTETRTLACPAATPSGTWTQQRSYEVWSDGSKKNYGAWDDVTVCQNEAPVAQNKAVSTNEDAGVSVVLSATDDHSNLSFEIAQAPSSGSASLSGATLVYTPPSDWNGSTSLTYRAKDPYGAYSAPARVSITVTPVNDAPVAQDKQIRTNEDVAGSVTLSATDIDSPAPTVFEIVTQPANATAAIQGNLLTVTPKSDWNGATALTYRAKDSAGAWSSPATVTVNVDAVSDAPVAQANSLVIDEDGSGKVVLSATDIDSAPSTVFEIVDAPANARAVISGSSLTVTPTADWNGTTTLTYRAQDTGNTSQWSAKATVTITVKAVNDAPMAQNKTVVTDEDVAGLVILTATDIDSPAPTVFEIVTQPANATATIQANQLTVTPARDWNGATSLTYRAKDSAGAWSAPAVVAVTVRPTGDAPIAVNKALVTKEDTAGTVTLSATDIDSPAASIFEVVSSSVMGRASIAGSTLTFTPSKDWNGTTSLTYRAQDDSGLWSAPAAVNITVEAVNDAPVSKALSMTVVEDKSASIQLQATDIDSAQNFVFEIVDAPRHVDYALGGDELTILANQDWHGTTGLTYRSRDDNGLWSTPAPVEIEVTPSPLSQVESGEAIMQLKWKITDLGR